jgi:hypothetical protein
MAYRSRVHPSIKMTPFELVFGLKMNFFENLSEKENQESAVVFLKRSVELRSLYEQKEKIAQNNMKNAQEIQEKVQDDRAPVIIEPLEIGTKVYLRSNKIQSKFEPINTGEYEIAGITKLGNYLLNNEDSNKLETSFPITKLIPIKMKSKPVFKHQEKVPSNIHKPHTRITMRMTKEMGINMSMILQFLVVLYVISSTFSSIIVDD